MRVSSTGYPGNKASFGSFQNIINNFPYHTGFISLFAGSGAIEFKKEPAPDFNIAIEISSKVISKFWKWKHGYRIVKSDCVSWLLEYSQQYLCPQSLIYGDAPYLLSSRASGRKYYENEWSEANHIEYLKLMKRLKCQVALSHYRCELYDRMLSGWHIHEWQVMTHVGIKKEALYMNYAPPKRLHQYNFLGKDFTDRQRIKRKKERFLNKLLALPELERYAIINAVTDYLVTS